MIRPSSPSNHELFSIDASDPSMIAAKEMALATLPQFWAALERAGEDKWGCLLKFQLTETEFIWAYDVTRNPDKIFGNLANDPFDKRFKAHQLVEIDPDSIIDWTYWNSLYFEGHFTTRVIMERKPEHQAREMAANLGWS
jgi:uncharacterized protein YegJ (DUF2314 family)